ncbi:MAG: general secretion pathway protein GspB [Steroidobacteraceae bacterium]
MSFILDALKKSESARQRQDGPGLFEVKIVPPRRGLPAWALIIGALLLINVVVLTWLMLRHPAPSPAPAAARAAVAPNPAPVMPTRALPQSGAGPASWTATPPTSTAAAEAALTRTSGEPSLATAEPPAPFSAGGHSVATAPTGGVALPEAPNPADLAPAIQPPASGGSAGLAAGAQGPLPLYAEIAAQPGSDLPRLHLDLHVYDPDPSKRYVMINMHILHTGDSLPDGVTVVAIRPDGVALSYRGREFLLPR